jgi:hypothetical protein
MPPFGSKHSTASRREKKHPGPLLQDPAVIRKQEILRAQAWHHQMRTKRRWQDQPGTGFCILTKEELYEQILMVKHPIIHCEDKLEKAYRYIDIVNSTNEEDEQRGRLLWPAP